MCDPTTGVMAMNDRAYFIREKRTKHLLRDDEVIYVISDGHNDIEIPDYGFFTIDTTEPITKPLLKAGRV